MKQEDLLRLIAAAKSRLSSDRQVAIAMGIQSQVIADRKAGRKKPQPEDIALLASIAGLEADKWTLRAMIEKHEGTAKGDRLLKALGKGLLATGAVIGSAGAHATAIFSRAGETTLSAWSEVLRCIDLLNIRTHRYEPA